MSLRRDALTAAAEMMLALEERACRGPDLVATVGRLETWPGATNASQAMSSSPSTYEPKRMRTEETASGNIEARMNAVAATRGVHHEHRQVA